MDSKQGKAGSVSRDLIELNLVGRSPALKAITETVKRLGHYDVTVAIYGETGTGKELVAQALHYNSKRSTGPFIPVNSGALIDSLFESEMFGYARGAFTDARREHAGLIEQAEGGTLFLDEIEALSLKGQVALLRFLQDKVYRKVGSERQHTANVRIIVASNVPPNELHDDTSRFREDLYHRLNVLPLFLPPLRERREDIEPLVQHFMTIFKARFDVPGKRIGNEGMTWLLVQDWSGNVRELENSVQRGLLLAEGNEIKPQHLQMPTEFGNTGRGEDKATRGSLSFNDARTQVVESFEQKYLQNLMAQSGGSVSRAARLAGKERRSLGRLLKKHHIDPTSYRTCTS